MDRWETAQKRTGRLRIQWGPNVKTLENQFVEDFTQYWPWQRGLQAGWQYFSCWSAPLASESLNLFRRLGNKHGPTRTNARFDEKRKGRHSGKTTTLTAHRQRRWRWTKVGVARDDGKCARQPVECPTASSSAEDVLECIIPVHIDEAVAQSYAWKRNVELFTNWRWDFLGMDYSPGEFKFESVREERWRGSLKRSIINLWFRFRLIFHLVYFVHPTG